MDFKFFRVVRIIRLVGIKLNLTICLSCLKQMSKFVLNIICHVQKVNINYRQIFLEMDGDY